MRTLLIILLGLALAACAGPGRRAGDVNLAVYDLGPPPALPASANWSLLLAFEIRAPAWLDNPGIEYRLAYAEPGRVRHYSQARWAAPPAILIQQRLVQHVDLIPVGQGGTNCLFRIDLDEFSQIFPRPEASFGLLQARVVLLDRSRNQLAEQAIRIERTAPSQDSRGGVAALAATVEQLGQDLERWQGELAARGLLKTCARPAA